jgi:type VI secretion system protein ImpH
VVQAIEQGALGEIHLTPAFMGLLGTAGALPLHYTELLGERETYQRDRTARAFLDIFTTRAVTLHYAAWKKYRLPQQYELDQRERFLPLVLSLAGLGLPGLRERMADGQGDVFDQAVAHYAGAIRQKPVSAQMVRQILSDYFGVPVALEQFVGAWYRVPEAQQTQLGLAHAQLGRGALAGERVWQRDLRLRLSIGPLARNDFDAFLPGGSAALALAKWLTLLTGAALEYDVRLVLRAEDVHGVCLKGEHGARLGWDSYLCTQPTLSARADTGYNIHALQ